MIEKQILLASGSPRRAFLLDQLDITHRVVVSDVEEIVPDGMLPADVPEYLARIKGEACIDQLKRDEILLAADTIVIYNNHILGKPNGQSEARMILRQLSGNKHEVITGAFLYSQGTTDSFSVTTTVELDVLTEEEISYYVNTYSPLDKAGSYGIQEWIGWAKINRIEGSYSNIMGLPTRELFQRLSVFE